MTTREDSDPETTNFPSLPPPTARVTRSRTSDSAGLEEASSTRSALEQDFHALLQDQQSSFDSVLGQPLSTNANNAPSWSNSVLQMYQQDANISASIDLRSPAAVYQPSYSSPDSFPRTLPQLSSWIPRTFSRFTQGNRNIIEASGSPATNTASNDAAIGPQSQEASTGTSVPSTASPYQVKSALAELHLQTLNSRGFTREKEAIEHAMDSFAPSAGLVYLLRPSQTGTDVWPDMREFSRTPARITPISTDVTQSQAQNTRPPFHSTAHLSRSSTSPTAGAPTWPQAEPTLLPLEVYEMIVLHLSRDDIKAMRLTCKEIEWRVSHFLFKTVVVPFNTEIYGMLQGVSETSPDKNGKGKGKQRQSEPTTGPNLIWKNISSSDVYNGHGIDVFRSFGPHMKRFGMSFEVDEEVLSALPRKELLQTVKSYWGEYEWPYPDYQRFKEIARIENTADETPLMVQAFSSLTKVEELALSIDAGTGWLRGPDVSLYRRIFNKPRPVFKSKFLVPDRRVQAQHDIWHMLKGLCSKNDGEDIANAEVRHRLLPLPSEAFDSLHEQNARLGMSPRNTTQLELHSILDFLRGPEELEHLTDILSSGSDLLSSHMEDDPESRIPDRVAGLLVFDSQAGTNENIPIRYSPLAPINLTKPQKEWLLETEWAQRAFISSYMLAIMDNPTTFINVHTLSLSRISDHYLSLLNRDDFWDSLPNLRNITILAIGEWQRMYKDEAGYVETKDVVPSRQSSYVEDLLTDIIAPRRNIISLNVGWASGGENATGVLGRNQHLLPCPLMPSRWRSNMSNPDLLNEEMILFPSVEHITLTNCWIVPTVLQLIVQKHCTRALKKLTLDSVSLTKNITNLDRALTIAQYPVNSENITSPTPVLAPAPVPAPAPTPVLAQAPLAAQVIPPVQQNVSLVQRFMQRIVGMTPQQVAAIPPQHFTTVVPQQLTLLTAQQLGNLTVQQMQVIVQQLGPLTPQQLANIAPQQLAALLNAGTFTNAHANTTAAPNQNTLWNRGFFPPNNDNNVVPAPPAPPANVPTNWRTRQRDGSWPAILDAISPGITSIESGSTLAHPSILPPNSLLESIDVKSCGYCFVNATNVQFEDMETVVGTRNEAVILRQYNMYVDQMLPSNRDQWHAQISQFMHERENAALMQIWDMALGWTDADARREVYYDGYYMGGTGRFSGVINRQARLELE
jgi:hypothetical protein